MPIDLSVSPDTPLSKLPNFDPRTVPVLGIDTHLPAVGRGALAPQGVDVVDIYHFDVQRRSDVRVSLASAGGRSFVLTLVTADGGGVGRGEVVRRQLEPGRYVAAVSASPGTRGGAYRLTLLVRDITTTTLALASDHVPRGTAIVLRPQVAPASGGTVDRSQLGLHGR